MVLAASHADEAVDAGITMHRPLPGQPGMRADRDTLARPKTRQSAGLIV